MFYYTPENYSLCIAGTTQPMHRRYHVVSTLLWREEHTALGDGAGVDRKSATNSVHEPIRAFTLVDTFVTGREAKNDAASYKPTTASPSSLIHVCHVAYVKVTHWI